MKCAAAKLEQKPSSISISDYEKKSECLLEKKQMKYTEIPNEKLKSEKYFSSKLESQDSTEFTTKDGADEAKFVENWKGQASLPPKKRSRYSYLVPQKEIERMNFKSKKSNRPIGLLQNGNKKPILIDKEMYTLANTCAFDCLVQIFASSLVDSEEYNDKFKTVHNDIFLETARNTADSKITYSTYKNRAKILRKICKTVKTPNMMNHIAAQTTVSYMAQNLYSSHPSLMQHVYCDNTDCTFEKISLRNVVITISFENESLNTLQNKLDEQCFESDVPCCQQNVSGSVCPGKRKNEIVLSDRHLIIEIINQDFNKRHKDDILEDPEVVLDDIPKSLKHGEAEYHLRGAVSFTTSHRSLNVIGHYIAFCRRNYELWEEYNDMSKGKFFCPKKKIIQCQLLFYSI